MKMTMLSWPMRTFTTDSATTCPWPPIVYATSSTYEIKKSAIEMPQDGVQLYAPLAIVTAHGLHLTGHNCTNDKNGPIPKDAFATMTVLLVLTLLAR